MNGRSVQIGFSVFLNSSILRFAVGTIIEVVAELKDTGVDTGVFDLGVSGMTVHF